MQKACKTAKNPVFPEQSDWGAQEEVIFSKGACQLFLSRWIVPADQTTAMKHVTRPIRKRCRAGREVGSKELMVIFTADFSEFQTKFPNSSSCGSHN